MKLPIRILKKTKKYDSGKIESLYYVQKKVLWIWFTWTEKVASDTLPFMNGMEINTTPTICSSLTSAKECVERIQNIYTEVYKGNYIRKFRDVSSRNGKGFVYINLSNIYNCPNPKVDLYSYPEYSTSLEKLKEKIDDRTFEKSKTIFKI